MPLLLWCRWKMTKVLALVGSFAVFAFSNAAVADWFVASEIKAAMKKAEAGDVAAQMLVGLAYDAGKGAPHDPKEALKWYRLAADQGNAEAQNSVGSVLQAEKDYAEALPWYEKASAQGHALATNNLAYLYDLGLGVPQDRKKGFELYSRAADLGYTEAMWNIANMYGAGQLGKVDMVAACVWTMRADKYARPDERRLKSYVARVIPQLERSLSPEDLSACKKEAESWAPIDRRKKESQSDAAGLPSPKAAQSGEIK